MNKIALIGDTHFSRKAEHPLIKKHIKDGQAAFFDFLIIEFKKHGIKTVLFTGDIHDTRNYVNVEALVQTKRLFQEKMKDFDIHIILGNHDMYYENSYDVTTLELFEDIPNVTIYRSSVAKANFLGKSWYMFPWIIQDKEANVISFLEKMATQSKTKKDNTVLFGHFEMMGINMEGNNISTFGMEQNLFINAARLVLSGHYHGQSHTKKGDSELYYLGSPYAMTFANANQKHGVWLIDEDMKMEFIENTISPTFIDIWDTDNLDELPDLTNSFVRIFMGCHHTREEEFEILLKIDNKRPILKRLVPYKGTKEESAEQSEYQREANQILGMDAMALCDMYINQNFDDLPKLKLSDDPRNAVLLKIKEYRETINVSRI